MLKTIKKDYWRYTLNKTIYRCMNNDYTPKNGDFFFLKKRWKDTLNPVMLSLMIYEIILTFNFLIGSGVGGGGGVGGG